MSIFKECPVCGAHLDPGETCNCREPKLVTYADWEAAGSFEKAARPCDAVEERIVDEFQGREKYEAVINCPNDYIIETKAAPLLLM